jgi:hypothetical protein
VKPKFVNLYYKLEAIEKVGGRCATNTGNVEADLEGKVGYCVTIPNGLRFVKGYNMTTMSGGPMGADAEYLKYGCRESTGEMNFRAGATDKHSLEELTASGVCQVGDNLHVKMDADPCWDGVNLDTIDHRSHLAQSTRYTGTAPNQFYACPLTHPYNIPFLTIQAEYRIDSTFNTWEWTSDRQMRNMGMTIVRGQTLHFDYHEAWSPTVKALWTKNCLQANRTCSSGDLGNGFKIKGAGVPDGGWPVPAKVPEAGVN